MDLHSLRIAVTCVRVPILGGHGESINIETERPLTVEAIRHVLGFARGVSVMDNPISSEYPTPYLANNKDDVFVGRIRIDDSAENGAHLWVVSDNLRKGAATNAVQIAQSLVANNWLSFAPKENWQ
jgi:aspartate-semialdehyde dehydrogenase